MVEFDGPLAALCVHEESVIGTCLSRRVRFVSSRESALSDGRTLLSRYGIRRILPVYLTGGARIHQKEYRFLTESLQDLVQQFWHNRGTHIRLGRRWIGNLMRNVLAESISVQEAGRSLSSTVILIGAGPNLDHHVPFLRKIAKDPGIVPREVSLVALDTALPALAAAGITPEIVFSMDAQLANAYDLLPWRWNSVTLVADVTVHPSIPRRFAPHRRAFFSSSFADRLSILGEPVLQEIPRIPARGSVAPAAIELLVRAFRVRTIVTVGIDFWYSSPRTHARETGPHRRRRTASNRLADADGGQDLLVRPRTEGRLRDGNSVSCDAVLEGQARQVSILIGELSREFPDLVVATPDREGLPTGAVVTDDLPGTLRPRPGQSPGIAGDKPSAAPYREHGRQQGRQTRIRALNRILRQLEVQERVWTEATATGAPLYLDADLEFVALDLPQWPLLLLRQEWMLLHEQALMRSLRDYRRRLTRALAAAEPHDAAVPPDTADPHDTADPPDTADPLIPRENL